MASTDTSRPDYVCPAYLEMEPRWDTVEDVRASTVTLRDKKDVYLPKFEAETAKDWAARVAMTFASDSYALTLTEHVGLVMGEPITLGEDVPPAIEALMEDIDGEGNHLDVFAQSALDAALHLGHCVLVTDYPSLESDKKLSWTPPPGFSQSMTTADAKAAQVRPYVTLYKASDVLSPRTATVGGVKVLVGITLRETGSEPDGEFGVKSVVRYREISQAVAYDKMGRARSLGAITWRTWKEKESKSATGAVEFEDIGSGVIVGPTRIAARTVYGGEKLGYMHTKPHLYGLASKCVEETQVSSDYASVMHKCNVPTPIFIGRNVSSGDGTNATVQMGQGIDIPVGGSAMMLEPSGAALGATRERLQDIQLQMQRQGAASAQGEGGPALTATEAAQNAKARNAKLRRAARSLQDALEGVLADMASFMGLAPAGLVKSGGSVTVCQDFAGQTLDPAYLSVLVTAYRESTLTMEELRSAIHTGQLPEEFDYADVIELLADEKARHDQNELEAAERLRLAAAA